MASLRISTYETIMGSDKLATALKEYESEYGLNLKKILTLALLPPCILLVVAVVPPFEISILDGPLRKPWFEIVVLVRSDFLNPTPYYNYQEISSLGFFTQE